MVDTVSLHSGVPPTNATSAGDVIDQLRHWPGPHRVAVGLSGGVDSSLTAALLQEAGWEVEGVTLWLMRGKGACCSEGLVDAAAICEQLAIPHHVVDSRQRFQEQIVNTLVQGYAAGLTPLPCSRCNRDVKFGPMIRWAREERGIPRLATGHYARVLQPEHPDNRSNRYQLRRGRDRAKDQSYFLYDLSQEVLAGLVFPLGDLCKHQTRELAHRRGLRTASKPESQDLCLAERHGSMRAFLDVHLPPRQGEITLRNGTVLGHHDGIEHFTVGQRRGLGIAWGEPLHVVHLDPALNRIVVAPRSEAAQACCTVGEVNWVSIAPPEKPRELMVQVRYRSEPTLAQVTPCQADEGDRARGRPHRVKLQFAEPQFSLTPGQAAVFYEGDRLIGGGLIDPDPTTSPDTATTASRGQGPNLA